MLLLLACGAPPPTPRADDPCVLARVPAPGPLAAEAAAAADRPLALALVRIREARLTGDPGFYSLADLAVGCALATDPASREARSLRGHVLIQFHRFAEAEALLAPLADETGAWRDRMLLGDARMERGDLAGAEAAYATALEQAPSLETYDRMSHLAWLLGDLPRALALAGLALEAGTESDPEPMAWAATHLGWLKALDGQRPNELGLALTLVPTYGPAHLALGRFLLHEGRTDLAGRHLEQAGATLEAYRARREIDPSVRVEDVRLQDRRGWAIELAATDPAAAVALLEQELGERRDAFTRVAHGWAVTKAGGDGSAEIREALATGIAEPEALLLAAEALRDPELARRALARPVGLLPSERVRAEQIAGSQKKSQPE